MAFKPILNPNPKDSLLSPQEKKQRKLTFVLVGIILVTFIIFYFGFFYSAAPALPPSPSETTASLAESVEAEAVIRKIDFDVDFFKDSQFQALKIYGQWPLIIGETGRENPFLPY